MIKILHPLLCYYPSQAGGPANTIYYINKTLNPSFFDCKIISTQYGLKNSMILKEYSKNHNIVFFKYPSISYVIKVVKDLKTSNIVQFSSLFFPPTLFILFYAIFYKKTIIISPRGELYKSAVNRKKYRKKLWLFIIKLVQTKINFHATNYVEMKLIRKTFTKAKSYITIPNYIEMPNKIKHDFNMNFVFVGRINPIKNIQLLIDSIFEVKKTFPKVRLDILGSARLDYEKIYLKQLQAQINEKGLNDVVFFKGHLEGDSKNQIIASSLALLLPSKSENFGNVVLESLSQGTPVIASKNTPWEILNEFNAGFWVDCNIQEFTKCMISILELNESSYQYLRKKAYELCSSKFDIKMNINSWEIYYNKINNV